MQFKADLLKKLLVHTKIYKKNYSQNTVSEAYPIHAMLNKLCCVVVLKTLAHINRGETESNKVC